MVASSFCSPCPALVLVPLLWVLSASILGKGFSIGKITKGRGRSRKKDLNHTVGVLVCLVLVPDQVLSFFIFAIPGISMCAISYTTEGGTHQDGEAWRHWACGLVMAAELWVCIWSQAPCWTTALWAGLCLPSLPPNLLYIFWAPVVCHAVFWILGLQLAYLPLTGLWGLWGRSMVRNIFVSPAQNLLQELLHACWRLIE